MGCCVSDRKTDADAARQLDSLFVLSNKDFLRVGNQDDLDKYYDILDQDSQSHANCSSGLITEKSTGETKFCKIIIKSEAM